MKEHSNERVVKVIGINNETNGMMTVSF